MTTFNDSEITAQRVEAQRTFAQHLRELKEEMLDRLDEIHDLLREAVQEELMDPICLRRAEAYWLAHVRCGLTSEHEYMSDDNNLDETIRELLEGEDDE